MEDKIKCVNSFKDNPFDDKGKLIHYGIAKGDIDLTQSVMKAFHETHAFYLGDSARGCMVSFEQRKYGSVEVQLVYLDYTLFLNISKKFTIPKKCAKFTLRPMEASIFYQDKKGNYVKISGDGKTLSFDIESADSGIIELSVKGDFKKPATAVTAVCPFEKRRSKFFIETSNNCVEGRAVVSVSDKFKKFIHIPNAIGYYRYALSNPPTNASRNFASLSTIAEGKLLGLNLSYWSNNDLAKESYVVFGNQIDFVEGVHIAVPFSSGKPDYLKVWDITSDDGKIELKVFPLIDINNIFAPIRSNITHQIYGRCFGKYIAPDGHIVEIKHVVGTVKRFSLVYK